MNFYFGFTDAIEILSPYGSTGSACQDHGFGSQGIQDNNNNNKTSQNALPLLNIYELQISKFRFLSFHFNFLLGVGNSIAMHQSTSWPQDMISQHFQIFDSIPLTKCLFPLFTERPMPKAKETPQNSPLSLLTMSLVSLVWLPESSLPPSINQVGRRLNCLLNVYQHRPHRVRGWLRSSQSNDSVFELREVNVAGRLVNPDKVRFTVRQHSLQNSLCAVNVLSP